VSRYLFDVKLSFSVMKNLILNNKVKVLILRPSNYQKPLLKWLTVYKLKIF